MNIYGHKGQAGNVQPERLNPMTLISDAIVQPKFERFGGGNNKTSRLAIGHKSNRSIDATISFYGTYIQLNEQVTLQNQDPKFNTYSA